MLKQDEAAKCFIFIFLTASHGLLCLLCSRERLFQSHDVPQWQYWLSHQWSAASIPDISSGARDTADARDATDGSSSWIGAVSNATSSLHVCPAAQLHHISHSTAAAAANVVRTAAAPRCSRCPSSNEPDERNEPIPPDAPAVRGQYERQQQRLPSTAAPSSPSILSLCARTRTLLTVHHSVRNCSLSLCSLHQSSHTKISRTKWVCFLHIP